MSILKGVNRSEAYQKGCAVTLGEMRGLWCVDGVLEVSLGLIPVVWLNVVRNMVLVEVFDM